MVCRCATPFVPQGACHPAGRFAHASSSDRLTCGPDSPANGRTMGLYVRYVFPWILDFTMGLRPATEQRPRALSDAHGDVLEIGFGTGLNLPHYPAAVSRLTAVDPSRALRRRVQRRVAAARMPVEIVHLDAARLPFDAGRFDCVVTTWTLCSIEDVASRLARDTPRAQARRALPVHRTRPQRRRGNRAPPGSLEPPASPPGGRAAI